MVPLLWRRGIGWTFQFSTLWVDCRVGLINQPKCRRGLDKYKSREKREEMSSAYVCHSGLFLLCFAASSSHAVQPSTNNINNPMYLAPFKRPRGWLVVRYFGRWHRVA